MSRKKYLIFVFITFIMGLLSNCQEAPPIISETISSAQTGGTSSAERIFKTLTPTTHTQKTAEISKAASEYTHTPIQPQIESPQAVSITPTPAVDYPNMVQNCLQIQEDFPKNIIKSGKIVFWWSNEFHVFTSNHLESELWKNVGGGDLAAISEDGAWLAYVDEPLEQLIVLSDKGSVAATLPWDPWDGETQWFRWFDDERLILYSSTRPYEVNLILNPFTGEKIEVLASYSDPEYYDYEYDPHLTWEFPVVYDSSLTRAIYLRKNGLVLWDLLNQEPLWHIDHAGAELARPVWSPDQSYAIVTLTKYPQLVYELYRVDRDGGIAQLTNFEAVYPSPQIFHPLKWSPDGRYLAFWFYTSEEPFDPDAEARLMVWDMGMNKITDYCIGDIPGSNRDDSIIWSPDSHQIAVTISHFWEPSEIIVVDLAENIAGLLGEEPYMIGWLRE